jgi:hypothetical protein
VGAIGKDMSSRGLLLLTLGVELWEAPENSSLTSSWRISVRQTVFSTINSIVPEIDKKWDIFTKKYWKHGE